MRFIVLILSIAAFAIANPVDQVKQSSSNPDISKLPLEHNIQKPADATKTSFDASKDPAKPKRENPPVSGASQPLNNAKDAKPQTSVNNEKTTSPQQQTSSEAQNTPQATSNIQKIPSPHSNPQRTSPQQQSGLNNNNQKPTQLQPSTLNNNQRTQQPSQTQQSFNNNNQNNQRKQPLISSHSAERPIFSSSSRVRRDTEKTNSQRSAPAAATSHLANKAESEKSSFPAPTTQLQNSQKKLDNSQKVSPQAPVASSNTRNTREAPKDNKSSQKAPVNQSNLPKVPLTNGNSAAKKPENAQQNPSSTPVRKTREAPKDVKTQVSQQPASNSQKSQTTPAKSAVNPSTSAPIRKTREAPKDVKTQVPQQPASNSQKTPSQVTPVKSAVNPSTSAPIRKTREAPKDVKTPTNVPSSQPVNNHNSHKLQPQPVNSQKSQSSQTTPAKSALNPSTTAPVRKTREVPKDVKTQAPQQPSVNAQKSPQHPASNSQKSPQPKQPTNAAKPSTTNNNNKNSQNVPASQKNQQQPINPSTTAAPLRKTRDAPNPIEQSKIVPSSHQSAHASQLPTDNKAPAFVHPVPVDHILNRKPDIPSQVVKTTENKPQLVGVGEQQKPLIDQAKSPFPISSPQGIKV